MSHSKDRDGFYRVRNEHGHTICRDIEDEQTARLHDAAPDLLVALRALLSYYPTPVEPGTGFAEVIGQGRRIIREIKGKESTT